MKLPLICESDHEEECKRCSDTGGYCIFDNKNSIDYTFYSKNFTCKHEKKTSLGVILGNIFSLCF